MITLKQIDKKQKDFILNMDLEQLQNYIDNIIKEYYLNIVNNDNDKIKIAISNLNNIRLLHQDKNIDKYIEYSFIMCFNDILINSTNNNLELIDLNAPGLTENENTNIYRQTTLDKVIEHRFNNLWLEESDNIRNNLDFEGVLKYYNFDDYKHNLK